MRNVLNEGWGVSVVLPLGHAFGGKPGDGGSGDVVVFECGFKLSDKVGECTHGYGSSGDGVLSERGGPCEGGSLGHVGKGEGNHFVVGVIDFVIDEEVEAYSIQPLGGFVIRPIKGFRCSNTEFSGFRVGHR